MNIIKRGIAKIWERDLNSNIEADKWKNMVADTYCNIIHRYYYTPVKLKKCDSWMN